MTRIDRRVAQETEWRVIEQWDPVARPEHCSNCLHATVYEIQGELRVRCAMGHGKRGSLPYWSLMRRQHPMAFLTARQCPDWHSMSEDE